MASAAPRAEVIGEENRSRLSAANQDRFAGVGRLICTEPATGNRVFTTATLVGDRSTILGVGHFRRVAAGPHIRAIDPGDCRFHLYDAKGEAIFSSPIEDGRSARPIEDYYTPSDTTPDWAVHRLSQRAPAAIQPLVLRALAVGALSRQAEVFMVGYHREQYIPDNEKVYSPDCSPRRHRNSARMFRHGCDSSIGSSGALLFVETAQGPRAVGINHASDTAGRWNLGQIFARDLVAALPGAALE